jgi:hypothetical protein
VVLHVLADSQPEQTLQQKDVAAKETLSLAAVQRLELRLAPEPGSLLLAARVRGGGIALDIQPPGDASLSFTVPITASGTAVTYILDWRTQEIFAAADAPQSVGRTELVVRRAGQNEPVAIVLGPSVVNREVPPLGQLPCLTEACDLTGQNPLFPVLPPWMHAGGRIPADPKVWVLAILYGYLAQELTRHKAGTTNEVWTARRIIAVTIYNAAAGVLFGARTTAERTRLTEALRSLFQAWCTGFLYPGPSCGSGVHGVVIGCATIAGGVIQNVDPWGGRRHVVHYPLLEHWGKQIGLVPFDELVGRVVSLVCCVAGLPSADDRSELLVPIGRGVLAIGEPTKLRARMTADGATLNAMRTLPLVELAGTAQRALRLSSATSGPYDHLTLEGAGLVHLFVPAQPVSEG